ncbi:unnamed protein product [Closterium sp. Yama58-4]|nr:unnamed protein product [Closterium sp. Yama58-4]
MANCVLRRAVPQALLAASPAIKGSSAIKGAPVVVRIAPSRDVKGRLATAGRSRQRDIVRLALPSKGRMAEDTLALLKECELTVRKPNPRQYIAEITEIEGLEVWFQRASDCVRKLLSGDVDMTIVDKGHVDKSIMGFVGEGVWQGMREIKDIWCGGKVLQRYRDIMAWYGRYDYGVVWSGLWADIKQSGRDDADDPNLVIVHDSLGFGKCHLSVAVPSYGIFERINSIQDLIAMPQWSADNPLRIVTGYTHLGRRFFDQLGFPHVQLSTADGALEAAPAMGTADAILDLVSTGTTLKENNLKELKGADVLNSQGVFVVSRRALEEREGLLGMTKEMLERIEAHLCARDQYIVTANMRGLSEEDVAHRVLEQTSFPGLQGPTISRVYSRGDDSSDGAAGIKVDYFSATVVVPRAQIYKSIRELRKAGGSGVLRSALYTWLPFGLRIGIFFFCLVAFSLLLATKATVTSYSAGAFLVGMTILGFIFAVMLLVYNSVRICVAGSEAYDWMMDIVQFFESYVSPFESYPIESYVVDIVQFFESYIMSLLLFAAATSGAAACNTWWNTGALNNMVLGDYSTSATKAMLASLGLSTTLPGTLDYESYINQYINDANADLSKVRGACAMAFFAAFIYIAMFWYYTIRMYKRGVLKAVADAAPAAVKANVPPYNV